MSIVNQLFGGFETIGAIGQGVANGYLIFRLSQDAVVNSTTLICSGFTIRINLDSLGLIVPNQSIWPNDVMTPNTTGYHVSAYTANGQLLWGPNLIQVLSSPIPFNTNAWIPS